MTCCRTVTRISMSSRSFALGELGFDAGRWNECACPGWWLFWCGLDQTFRSAGGTVRPFGSPARLDNLHLLHRRR
jgi:hypothetical protein